MYSPEKAIRWAVGQVGVSENPPGSNHVPYWPEFQRLSGVTWAGQGEPWCGAFLWLALYAGGWVAPPTFVSVAEIEAWARHRRLWTSRIESAQPGDAVVIGGHGVHVELVRRNHPKHGLVATVGGNVADSVALRSRAYAECYGIAAFSELAGPDAEAPQGQTVTGSAGHVTLITSGGQTASGDVRVQLPTLRRGMHGASVKAAQRLVGADADGIFGPLTEAAVRRWQTDHGLQIDGIIGRQTWASLTGGRPA